jgi:hypothetical protein
VDHTDGLGSVREVTSGNGSIVATYQTDAFGNPLATGGTFSQPFQLTGRQADPTAEAPPGVYPPKRAYAYAVDQPYTRWARINDRLLAPVRSFGGGNSLRDGSSPR